MAINPGDLLKAKRESKGYSERKASELSGISRRQISRFERNDYKRSSDKVEQYVCFLFEIDAKKTMGYIHDYLGEKSSFQKMEKQKKNDLDLVRKAYVASVTICDTYPYHYQVSIHAWDRYEINDEEIGPYLHDDIGSLICLIDSKNGLRFCTQDGLYSKESNNSISIIPYQRFTKGSREAWKKAIEPFIQYCADKKIKPSSVLSLASNEVKESVLFKESSNCQGDQVLVPAALISDFIDYLNSDRIDAKRSNGFQKKLSAIYRKPENKRKLKTELLETICEIDFRISTSF